MYKYMMLLPIALLISCAREPNTCNSQAVKNLVMEAVIEQMEPDTAALENELPLLLGGQTINLRTDVLSLTPGRELSYDSQNNIRYCTIKIKAKLTTDSFEKNKEIIEATGPLAILSGQAGLFVNMFNGIETNVEYDIIQPEQAGGNYITTRIVGNQ